MKKAAKAQIRIAEVLECIAEQLIGIRAELEQQGETMAHIGDHYLELNREREARRLDEYREGNK